MTASVAKSHTWDRRTPEKERPPEKRCTSRPGHKTQKRTRAVRVLSYIYTVITCTFTNEEAGTREKRQTRWSSATGGPSLSSLAALHESRSISIVYQSDNKLLVRTLKRHRFWILCGNRQGQGRDGAAVKAAGTAAGGVPRVHRLRCVPLALLARRGL